MITIKIGALEHQLDGRAAEIVRYVVEFKDDIGKPPQLGIEFHCSGNSVNMSLRQHFNRQSLPAPPKSPSLG